MSNNNLPTAEQILRECRVTLPKENLDQTKIQKEASQDPFTATNGEVPLKADYISFEKLAEELDYAAQNSAQGISMSKIASHDLVEKTARTEVIRATMEEIGLFDSKVAQPIEKMASAISEAIDEDYSPEQIAEFLSKMNKGGIK